MKISALSILSVLVLFTLIGCDSSSGSANYVPEDQLVGFLWKPRSESSGGLVVLLPPNTRGRTEGIATVSGSFGSESAPLRHENHNGGRPHFYFSKPGAAYGSNVTVQAPLSDGSVVSVIVPEGSQRFEK